MPARGEPLKFDERRRRIFLEEIERTDLVTRACDAAGISRSTAYRVRDEDEDFAEAWAAASERCLDRIEQVAIKLATEGEYVHGRIDKDLDGVISGPDGQPLRRVDPRHVQFMLKTRRRDRYGDKVQVDANVSHGVLAVPTTAQDSTAWESEVARHEGDGGGEDE